MAQQQRRARRAKREAEQAAQHGVVVARIDPHEQEALAAMMEYLTPAERARAMQLLHERKQLDAGAMAAPLTLREFVDRVSGGRFIWYRYAITLADVLQRVVDGLLKRVLIFAPPRHGKSELTSRFLPAYYLYRHPERWVALFSYGADLAHKLAKAARTNFFAYHNAAERGAMKEWETGAGGGMWASGVGGAALGKGFHLGVIDDPVKNAEEAHSETKRDVAREWYRSVFTTRAEPNAAVVIIMQRWHEDDLAGWLLDEEWSESGDDGTPERWHIVNFEAIKSSEKEIAEELQTANRPTLFPPTCTIEPDWRKPGEALCEERFPLRDLLRRMRRLGAYFWNALYQQRPRPRGGLLFKIDKLKTVEREDVPWQRLRIVRYWDFGGSEQKDANFTVGMLVGFDDVTALTYLLDCVRGQWEPGERNAEIVKTTTRDVRAFDPLGDRSRYTVYGEMQPAAAGKDFARVFRALVSAMARVFVEPVTGSKEVRADPFAADVNGGDVRMLRAEWNGTVRRELAEFPQGKNDDIVDAAAGGAKHAKRVRTSVATDLPPSMGRIA